jgi:hypothetical protein
VLRQERLVDVVDLAFWPDLNGDEAAAESRASSRVSSRTVSDLGTDLSFGVFDEVFRSAPAMIDRARVDVECDQRRRWMVRHAT